MKSIELSSIPGIIALALIIGGSAYVSGPSMANQLAEVPWEHMPAATMEASSRFYDRTFIQAAAAYLVFIDEVGEIQADAYATTGAGVSAAAVVMAETPPVAGVASWYIDAKNRVDMRLTPR